MCVYSGGNEIAAQQDELCARVAVTAKIVLFMSFLLHESQLCSLWFYLFPSEMR